MKFGTFLLSLAQPILAKILLALGFSVITVVGVEAAITQVKNLFIANLAALPADMLNLALYLWVGKAVGIIFGAVATKLLLWSIQNATSIIGKSPQ
ncbi:hypothetical protein M2165_004230 [Variovorax sp. TBS-050B]|uniref:DUF2523 family protein n=1 Tax=Variovorax sp. TBS-050B TaxID=2940551 RepID=UPI002476523D|nr:DUF2523 family protein [Variovorax sp. TBS-050B]MDH6594341.1 hypothetical protein [Variovorax sp. TBS-050B]